jgi:hypothetical protein
MILRRRRLPAELQVALDAFATVVVHVERAKAALTESVPSTRFAGRPLVDSLFEFEQELAAAAEGMAAWRRPEVEGAWAVASEGLGAARRRAERLRLDAPDPGGFEGLIGLIGGLLAPLDVFADARAAFSSLRR